ncbi:hypothetical protein [Fulvimonas yonginensis]|uniref:Uncharacterized protein n=1 Tax=Fulvimonas yonginensis TaxID=1495200 RepID=A0ABU8JB45_9GAMM
MTESMMPSEIVARHGISFRVAKSNGAAFINSPASVLSSRALQSGDDHSGSRGPSSTLGASSSLQVMGVAKTSTAAGYAFTNGASQSVTFPTLNTSSGTLYMGYYEASGAWWLNGHISEAIMLNGYVETDRSALEANQRTYFGV